MLTDIAEYVAIILGAVILIAIIYGYVKTTKISIGGSTLALFGVVLVGYPLFKTGEFEISPKGGVHGKFAMIERAEAGGGVAVAPNLSPAPTNLGGARTTSAAYRIDVINSSKTVTDSEVEAVIGAFQKQISEDFSPVWGVDAKLSFQPGRNELAGHDWGLFIMDASDQAAALAYHQVSDKGIPVAKVFAATAQQYNVSWTVAASHQLLEMLVNPRTHLTVLNEASGGLARFYAYEVADPCEADQDSYQIDGVKVSDFVYPTWFDGSIKPESVQFDHMRRIHKPLQLCAGGYIPAFEAKSGAWTQLTQQ